MPRPQRPWFRFYVEALSDRKLRRLTPAQRWLWVAVLGAARQSPIGGYLVVSDRDSMDAADLADIAGMAVKDVERALPLFERSGMITRDDAINAWYVTNWAERQYESDNVTERTRKHRSKEQRRNVPTSFPGTPPETEADTETEVVVARTRLAPDERKSRIAAAATLIAERRGSRERGERYFHGTVRGIVEDYREQANRLLSEQPTLTPDELAEALEPPPPPPQYPLTVCAECRATYTRKDGTCEVGFDVCPMRRQTA